MKKRSVCTDRSLDVTGKGSTHARHAISLVHFKMVAYQRNIEKKHLINNANNLFDLSCQSRKLWNVNECFLFLFVFRLSFLFFSFLRHQRYKIKTVLTFVTLETTTTFINTEHHFSSFQHPLLRMAK